MEQLKLYQIDMKYVRNLHNADDRVESVSPQIGKANRVFVGIVVVNNNKKYCIPLSHPKDKHKKMANNSELHKIVVEDKLIGVLNFNLMIPVTDKQLISVDLKINQDDSPQLKAWKNLCIKEQKWCRKPENETIIRDKARNIYLLCTEDDKDKPTFKGKKRCLDFLKLEEVCRKYNEKDTQHQLSKEKLQHGNETGKNKKADKGNKKNFNINKMSIDTSGTIAVTPAVAIPLPEHLDYINKNLQQAMQSFTDDVKLTFQSLGSDIRKIGSDIKDFFTNTTKNDVKQSGKHKVEDRPAKVEKQPEARTEEIDRSNKPNLSAVMKSKQKEADKYNKERTVSPQQHKKNKGRDDI